ncbi:hypothetical protein ACSDR0_47020 [Streptosporangium sp. G11]|uniref:hypothetical protein n=1 Tax=Streptosporangium sp. G11 TaxID=3436926 RepID=UPI003EBAD17F
MLAPVEGGSARVLSAALTENACSRGVAPYISSGTPAVRRARPTAVAGFLDAARCRSGTG